MIELVIEILKIVGILMLTAILLRCCVKLLGKIIYLHQKIK